MQKPIKAIFFDVGNTLRFLVKDEEHQRLARERITSLVGGGRLPDEFCKELEMSYKVYRKWAFETLSEASEFELWNRWLLPDSPPEKIAPIASELTYQYRQLSGRRVLIENAKPVLEELFYRGYFLGIISNLITKDEIPIWLQEDGLDKYFQVIVLSSVFGKRKPSPEIFTEAIRLARIDPKYCAYIGDNPNRDVAGARMAGFKTIVLLQSGEFQICDTGINGNQPDYKIQKFKDLLRIFPVL